MELFKDQKPVLRRNFPQVHADRADLYVYFYARALELLRENGRLVFISSNKWLKSGYGAKLRAHLSNTARIRTIIDFGDLPVFEAASSYPMIIVGQKGLDGMSTSFTRVRSLDAPYPDVRALIAHQGQVLSADAIAGATWSLSDQSSSQRVSAMRSAGVSLSEYVGAQIYMGVKTGLNSAFVIDGATRARLIASDPRSAEVIKPFVRGDGVRRWRAASSSWLIYTFHGVDSRRYPAVIEYLRPFRRKLEDRATRQAWYELQQPQRAFAPAYEATKIVYPDIAEGPRFALDESGAYPGNTAYAIPCDDLFLLAVLNSEAVEEFYSDISAQVRGGYLRFFRQYVERIPVPRAPRGDQAAIEDLAERCVKAKGVGPQISEWESEINERVATLYGPSNSSRRATTANC